MSPDAAEDSATSPETQPDRNDAPPSDPDQPTLRAIAGWALVGAAAACAFAVGVAVGLWRSLR